MSVDVNLRESTLPELGQIGHGLEVAISDEIKKLEPTKAQRTDASFVADLIATLITGPAAMAAEVAFKTFEERKPEQKAADPKTQMPGVTAGWNAQKQGQEAQQPSKAASFDLMSKDALKSQKHRLGSGNTDSKFAPAKKTKGKDDLTAGIKLSSASLKGITRMPAGALSGLPKLARLHEQLLEVEGEKEKPLDVAPNAEMASRRAVQLIQSGNEKAQKEVRHKSPKLAERIKQQSIGASASH